MIDEVNSKAGWKGQRYCFSQQGKESFSLQSLQRNLKNNQKLFSLSQMERWEKWHFPCQGCRDPPSDNSASPRSSAGSLGNTLFQFYAGIWQNVSQVGGSLGQHSNEAINNPEQLLTKNSAVQRWKSPLSLLHEMLDMV